MNKKVKDFINLEEEFFELDKESKVANMKLEFESPSEIFDRNSITKTPVFNDEFTEWMQAAFEYAPRGYKIDLDIAFNDMGEYTSEDLKSFFLRTQRWNLNVAKER